jgi:uncharacterized Fe-S cluster-containing radical SAM superfamily protein
MSTIDTDEFSATLRHRSIDLPNRRVLISRLSDSEQEGDLTVPPNCGGFGRIRHFRRSTTTGWPSNPLPIDPACQRLGLTGVDSMRAQVFQNAACNWRCWYCYVPFSLLAAKPSRSEWFTADQLIDRYRAEPNPPAVIDLSGGQPDLAPEWLVWTMDALDKAQLSSSVYLWSDDNLSNYYYFEYLSDVERERIVRFPNYGRVCCLKGFNDESFHFNTRAAPYLFERQFDILERLVREGLDIYCYATFTAPLIQAVATDIPRFMDRLQRIDPKLPLRLVPLEVQIFGTVEPRLNEIHRQALKNQLVAVEVWQRELDIRFSTTERSMPITRVSLQ